MWRWSCLLGGLLLLPQVVATQPGHVEDVNAVLYATADPSTGTHDIFAVDPVSGKTVNLTQGRVGREDGWSHPWEPAGNQYKVVFRQFRGTPEDFHTRIFLLEAQGSRSTIYEMSETFRWVSSFSWSDDNESFSFAQRTRASSSDTEVVIVTGTQVTARIPVPFGNTVAKWSPDGQWIALTSYALRSLLLISTHDWSVTTFPLAGRVSFGLAWGSDSKRLALAVDGVLTIVDVAGNVLQTFGTASDVDDWSSDGKYISYETRGPEGGPRQCHILFLGGVQDVDSGYVDEHAGVWSRDGLVLAFWASTGVTGTLKSLLVVGPDGTNPVVMGGAYNTMPPSWFRLPRAMLVERGF